MTKPLLLAAAASLAVSACATRAEPVQTVYLSGPSAAHHYSYLSSDGRNQVVILHSNDPRMRVIRSEARRDAHRHAAEARRHAREAVRMARLAQPDRVEIDRITRDAHRMGEEARRMGEVARQRGEAARLQGEQARQRGEEARARGEQIRRDAERLREQCERGEIRCTIVRDGVRIR